MLNLSTSTFKERCAIGPEVELVLRIYLATSLLAHVARNSSEHASEILESTTHEIDTLLDLFDYAVDQTARFGVSIPRNGGMPTTQYHRWFTWWENYLKGLPSNELHALETAVKTHQDVSGWRPPGDWKMS